MAIETSMDNTDQDTLWLLRNQPQPSTEKLSRPRPAPNLDWLSRLSTEELVETGYAISRELKARLARESGGPSSAPATLVTPDHVVETPLPEIETDIDYRRLTFNRLPVRDGATAQDDPGDNLWRIVLLGNVPGREPLALELVDDIVVGRATEQGSAGQVNLNLVPYQGVEKGVSRRHAVIRPANDGLQLFDLHSTNGTTVNDEELIPHRSHEIKDGDRISFGTLNFRLKVLSSPQR